jgi:hypothetical protein
VTQNSLQRQLARALLGLGIRIAPRHAAQWGEAILGELGEVKGEWAALMWAAGGAIVLAKHALVALIFPGKNAPALLPGGGFFEKEGPVRKASLGIIGACVAAVLLLLLAPAFRQGLGVSLVQWRTMSQVESNWPPPADPALKALERRAVREQDAEALAFVAARTLDAAESARLADEAVRLDPELTWIYGTAKPTPEASERWIQKLEQWDPQNALPYFMEAENIDNAQVESDKVPHNVDREGATWKKALAAAFGSSKLDAYRDRLTDLDRKVADRYDIQDPYRVISERCFPCLPSYASWDSSRYGKWELKSAEALEAQGDQKDALAKYWGVIRFGEMTKRMLFTYGFLGDAYKQVAAISRRQGEPGQAAVYRYFATNTIRERDAQIAEWQKGTAGNAVIQWNADVMKVAGLLLPIFGAILLTCGIAIVAKSRSLQLSSLRAGRGIAALGLGSAVGLLLSSTALYVSYWPYAEMFRAFIKSGNDARSQELMTLLDFAQVPLGAQDFISEARYVYYFWLVVIVLCAMALLVIAARHLHFRSKARVAS